jgi:hypothetical protein
MVMIVVVVVVVVDGCCKRLANEIYEEKDVCGECATSILRVRRVVFPLAKAKLPRSIANGLQS